MTTINLNIKADEELKEKLLQGLNDAGMLLVNAAKIEMTNEHLIDTGIGRNSLTYKVDARDTSCTVGGIMEYLIYLHEGTGLYAREGNGRKDVPWRYKTPDGKWHTTKGQKPNPFLEKAFNENVNEVRACFGGIL